MLSFIKFIQEQMAILPNSEQPMDSAVADFKEEKRKKEEAEKANAVDWKGVIQDFDTNMTELDALRAQDSQDKLKDAADRRENTPSRVWNVDTHEWDPVMINPNTSYMGAIPDPRSTNRNERAEAAALAHRTRMAELQRQQQQNQAALIASDPTAARLGSGWLGNDSGTQGTYSVGVADALPLAGGLRGLKFLRALLRPGASTVGRELISTAGKIAASAALQKGADAALDAAGVKNEFVRTAVPLAVSWLPWSRGAINRIPGQSNTAQRVANAAQAAGAGFGLGAVDYGNRQAGLAAARSEFPNLVSRPTNWSEWADMQRFDTTRRTYQAPIEGFIDAFSILPRNKWGALLSTAWAANRTREAEKTNTARYKKTEDYLNSMGMDASGNPKNN